MVAPANKTFTGSGTVTGSGNIMGNALQGYSFNFTANNQEAFFDGVVLSWQGFSTPSYIVDHMPSGVDTVITISGLTNAGMAFNGMQFQVIRSGDALIPGSNGYGIVAGTDLSFPDWQANWGLTGNTVSLYDGFTISWNA
jgi:hypothetical protein